MTWSITRGLLCLIDGSKGLYAALTKALDGYVVIQRCQWHKRENVISYLPKGKQDEIKKALQNAYDLPTYKDAKAALDALKPELTLINEDATKSLERRTRRNPEPASPKTHAAVEAVLSYDQLH